MGQEQPTLGSCSEPRVTLQGQTAGGWPCLRVTLGTTVKSLFWGCLAPQELAWSPERVLRSFNLSART